MLILLPFTVVDLLQQQQKISFPSKHDRFSFEFTSLARAVFHSSKKNIERLFLKLVIMTRPSNLKANLLLSPSSDQENEEIMNVTTKRYRKGVRDHTRVQRVRRASKDAASSSPPHIPLKDISLLNLSNKSNIVANKQQR